MSSRTSLTSGFVIAVLAVALILAGYGGAVAIGGVGGKTITTTITSTNSTSPYVVNLVIATNSIFNSTVGDQPGYFVLGPSGLGSTENLSLPANRLIELVITNYDDGAASLVVPNDNVVSGTTGGTVFVASNDNINASQGAAGIVLQGGEAVSSVPMDNLSHTFTIPALNLNIPVPQSSTVVAYFTITKAGTFIWFCETTCGSGADGTEGAMSTAGWMTGNVVAS
ncbi:MAG: hypothetical protein JRN57_01510 [Nitrososphaerota archaeon]|nr:hypothetical protein [Nitrososphaerota archaeon]MDG7010773.1 hypothetical protein [Nitrososphaerota archaeon]